ncbi:agmatine/peptidylarginine deiminase [Streptacidiphilus sp. MAP12-20]|uniref:agmatine deiminase family protein n=1 Tax=Streptacidiphilus sp. MAP12-20 TaxID=3156299 RepID=UPI0035140885
MLQSLAGAGALAFGATACSGTGGASSDQSSSAASAAPTTSGQGAATGRRLGAEWESHTRTFMAWPAQESIWGEQLPAVRADVAGLARAIAGYEAVVLLARPDQVDQAQQACGADVEVVPIPVDDSWARDTVPVFVEEAGTLKGVDFNFNGWGNKQNPHDDDAKVAAAVLAKYGIPRIRTQLVAEGGSFESDGLGTVMITESAIVNDNRNPGWSRDDIEAELIKVLGVQKIIWLAGVRGADITDAHVDSLVRFVAPGVVLLDQAFPGTPPDVWSRSADQARGVLQSATDARGKSLQIIDLPQPDPDQMTGTGKAFVSPYVNFYIGDKAVFMPKFGDAKADDRAKQMLADHFPGRDIVPVKIDTIASGGGGIHCSTHDQPGKPAA